jgi:hypothetical protein
MSTAHINYRKGGKNPGAVLWILGSTALLLAVGSPVCPASVFGIHADRQQHLSNAEFRAGLWGWSTYGTGASFEAGKAPDGRASAVVQSRAATQSSGISQRFSVGRPGDTFAELPQPGQPGQALEGMVRVWLSSHVGAGEVRVLLKSHGPGGALVIAKDTLPTAQAAKGRWITLRSRPLGSSDGRLQWDSDEVELAVEVDAPGRVWLDGALCGARYAASFALGNGSFEQRGSVPAAWDTQGTVAAQGAVPGTAPYYGDKLLMLEGVSAVSQSIALGLRPDAPAFGDRPEAGVWIQALGDLPLPPVPDPDTWIELVLRGRSPGSGVQELARVRHYPVASQAGRWIYLETQSLQPLLSHASLDWSVTKNFPGKMALDFAQVGQNLAVDGNPRRLATAGYVAWYRSPLSDLSTATPTDPRAIWGNWAWTAPPYGDPGNNTLAHNPDCATSPACFRTTGRRDGAVGITDGPGFLPLVGAYDSRDADVVQLHVDQARAIGLHSFVFDWMGEALNQQAALPGEESPNAGALEALFTAAEAEDGDFKLGLMMEPKVHMLGWVQGQPTFDDRKQGIAADLIWYLNRYGPRRALWRREGRPVVFIFEPGICMPSGPCMQDSDWQDIAAWVTAATGEVPEFIAGQPPASSSQSFAGALRWRLVGPEVLRFQSYANFLAGIEQAVGVAEVEDFARAVDREATDWAALDPARFSVAMAWPGFDDSGVAGWGSPNGLGSDGLPLAVRVNVSDGWGLTGGGFLAATGRAVEHSESDWLHLATWNDWNESTALEASYSRAYADAVRLGVPAPAAAEKDAFSRLRRTRAVVRRWMRTGARSPEQGDALEAVTRTYLARTFVGTAVAYD